ncbi:MAG: hypothetical protein ACTSU5_01230 [Promethearchaeota archaeon]
MVVKKYFRLIECWVDCDICQDKVALKIDKDEINSNLQTGIYVHYHKHANQFPSGEDDESQKEHTVAVYIDKNYNVRGVKCFFGDAPSSSEVGGAGAKIPIVVKKIPPMSVHLGMLSPDEYKVLQICDGNNTLEQVAEIADKTMSELEEMMERLRDKGLVQIIKRA